MIGHPLKVSQLLEEISRGDVLLPEIQRAYVWRKPQVARLMDSLYREYPAGQILLWDTINLPVTKELEGVEKPALPTAGHPKIVLDGQQRLTSLYRALGKEEHVTVCFHLDTQQFELFSNRMKSDPRWVSVRDVVTGKVDILDLLQRVEDHLKVDRRDPILKTYNERLQKVRSISEYKFPLEIFKSDDYEEVTELFVRINSAGTRLRAAELVLAQLALRLPGAIVKKFEEALEDYSDLDFELDPRFLTRALIAIGTGQSRFRHLTEFWKKKPAELEAIWGRTRKAIDCAVNFVRQNARFESSDWLQSLNALIPLVAFFDGHDGLAPDVEKGLLRWFYLASLRGRYSGSGETALDEDLKAVGSVSPIEKLIAQAVPTGNSPRVTADELDDAGTRNALFPLTYAAARKRAAKDWFKGVALTTDVVGADHEIQVHHVFAKTLLNAAGVRRKDRDEIANLAFLAAKPNRQISAKPASEYLPAIADAHPERLVAQCIPMDRSLWKIERFQDFLAARRELLAESINDLLDNP
jgi:hypothetical protein